MSKLFSFPNPVNDYSARLVAGFVVALAVATIALDVPWLTAVIAIGFFLRVTTGPKIDPIALLVTRGIVPALGDPNKPVPGPPKRFAQGLGFAMSATAAVLALGFGLVGAAYIVLIPLIFAASLESFLGFCMGCWMFGHLLRFGMIPESVCLDCLDVQARQRRLAGAPKQGSPERVAATSRGFVLSRADWR